MAPAALRPFPFLHDLRQYQPVFFIKDFMAALSVALMALPQSMAYAFVAGLPPQVGMFSAIFGTLFASAFGHSRYLIAGPTTQAAILLQSGLSEMLSHTSMPLGIVIREQLAMSLLTQIVLLVAMIQILAGWVGLGRLTQFTSRSVTAGYSIGVALALLITQLYPFFGIAPPDRYVPLYLKAWFFLQQLPLLHWPTLGLGIVCVAIFIYSERWPRQLPIPFLIFVTATLAVSLFHLHAVEGGSIADVGFGHPVHTVTLIGDIGIVPEEWPIFSLPTLDPQFFPHTFPLALAIAFLSITQAAAIGKTYASSQDPPYNENQEIYGLGVSNLACALCGGMPSGGNFYRSSLNYQSGAKTRFAGIFSGIILCIMMLFFGKFVALIPLVSLSALMILIAYQMLQAGDLRLCIRATRSDAWAVMITIIACLIFSFDTALYIGIGTSLILYLKQAAMPTLKEYSFNQRGKLRILESKEDRVDPAIAIFQTEGELFFGAADLLQTQLRLAAEEQNIQVIILQLLNIRHLDASVCLALRHLHRFLQRTQRKLILTGVGEEVYAVLLQAGLIREIGNESVFCVEARFPAESTRLAYATAKTWLQNSGSK